MTALAAPPLSSPSGVISELLARQRTLTTYGFALLAIAIPTLIAQFVDPRTVADVNVWVKPTKFLVSIGVFALTSAWFFGYVRPERRRSLLMRGTVVMLIIGGSFELFWIGLQAARGIDSHFNTSTPFYSTMYTLMGLFAVLFTATALPLAWEIARRPAEGVRADFRTAIVVGLVLTFVLGAGFGGYMSQQPGHSVGSEGGHVPIFGWNRSGGDLRVAHFMGVHAEQAIPLLAALVTGAAARMRWIILLTGSALYALVSVALFMQAMSGRPVLPL